MLKPLQIAGTLALALAACSKSPPADAVRAAAIAGVADAVKAQALRDLQNDLILLKAQLGAVAQLAMASPASPAAGSAPPAAAGAAPAAATAPVNAQARSGQIGAALYTCERLALAGRELADDATAQALLGEADALCAYQAPMAAGDLKLAVLAAARGAEPPKSAPADCGPIRDALNKVGAKYRNDSKIVELFGRFKTDCPRMRLFATARVDRGSSSGSSSSAASDRSAQTSACKKRCDDASFDCRSRCMYCGSCTTDKTWEWCNATCNSCKQGCEQNERFCQSSCGS